MKQTIIELLGYMDDVQLKNVLDYAHDELDAPNHEDQLLQMLESMIIGNTMRRVREAIAAADTIADKQAVNDVLDTILK